jgi:hypothetical protein
MQVYANKRPSVSSVNCWNQIFHNGGVRVYEADNYYDYYKVVPAGEKPKYFFGETAWMKTQSFAVDKSDFSAYNIFN